MTADYFAETRKLTVSVVSHGHGKLLTALLDDLSRLPSAPQIQVVLTLNLANEVVDLGKWPGLAIHTIRNEQPKGFGANHNTAFRLCTTPWFAVVNPDIRIFQDPFPVILATAYASAQLSALSPRIVNTHGQAEDHVRVNLSPLSLWRRMRKQEKHPDVSEPSKLRGKFYWLAGMFIVFRSSAYRNVRGFDERFFLYCEDYDICARLCIKGGHLVLVQNAVATHCAQRDSHRSLRHLRWHLASLARVWTSNTFWQIVRHARRE